MDEVSCRANRLLLDAARRRGVDVEALVAGFPMGRRELLDPSKRIAWALHVELLHRLERAVDGPAALTAIGAEMVPAESGDLLRRAARHVVSSLDLYRAVIGWAGPSLFPHLSFRLEHVGPRRIRTLCEIPREHAPSRAFFHLSAGAVARAPETIGLPPAQIAIEIDEEGRRGVFHLHLPEERSLLWRARRRLSLLARPSLFVEELEAQADALSAGYDALLRSRSDFRRVMDRLPIGVVVHRGGLTVYANPALTRTLGYDHPEELRGRSVLEFLHEGDRATARERMDLPAVGGDEPREYRAVRRDGSIVPCELLPAQAVEIDGTPARLVTVRDLSERKRQEQQMILADRMAAVGVIAASVAHEINNPLAYASASLEIVQRVTLASEGAPALVVQSLGTAREGLERVRVIVSDLKTLSRPDDERGVAIDVHAVLDSTLRLAARELARRATVTRYYGASLCARASAQRLGQVMLNLLINAAEAIPEGEDPAAHEIRVSTSVDDDGRVVVDVGDTGVGISDEVVGRIFEPFFTTKPIGSGTGLGLAICHRIVTKLGGELSVRSFAPGEEPTDGGPRGLSTVFRVALPPAGPISTAEPPHKAAWKKELQRRLR